MLKYSAIIAGGGPAGTAAAIVLARAGHSVLLVERSQYDVWRIGETLPPEARAPLEDLGVWEKFLSDGHLASHAIHAVWGGETLRETDFIFNAYGTGWHLDRRRFDQMLAEHAQRSGATVLRGAQLAAAAWEQREWRIRIDGSVSEEFRAGFLIDATGHASIAARLNGVSRLVFDRTIGAAGLLVPRAGQQAPDPMLLLEAVEDGWWYSAPLADGALIVAFITDADLFAGAGPDRNTAWLRQLDKAERTRARAGGFQLHGDVRVRPCGPSRLECAGGPGWIAVGDAAAAHDPLSADGITKALRDGLEAAQIIQDGAGGPSEHARRVSESFDSYMAERCQYYRWETRWPESIFWRRRQADPQAELSRRAGAG